MPKNKKAILRVRQSKGITEISCFNCGRRKPFKGARPIELGYICFDCMISGIKKIIKEADELLKLSDREKISLFVHLKSIFLEES